MIRQLSEKVSLITSDKLWIEDLAIQQLQTTAELPGMVRAVGLPDLHPGRGYPVGAVFFSTQLYPALVGNDIGCGMSFYKTDLVTSKVKLDKLDKQLGNLDEGITDSELKAFEELDFNVSCHLSELTSMLKFAGLSTDHLTSLGTLGGGNHFAELQAIDKVTEQDNDETQVNQKNLYLLVHTGSRGLGQTILRSHVDEYSHAGLPANVVSETMDYIFQHDAAVAFAKLNRKLIALRIAQRLRCELTEVLDINHNTVTRAFIGSVQGFLHRKGAAPSNQGLVVLPGSRGDYSYILKPHHVDFGSSELNLNSIAHGAGRKWARGDCKGRLFKLASPAQLSRTSLGGRVICEDRALIYEEAPQAYKNINHVLDSLVETGLVTVMARTKPILSYKTRGDCC